MPRLAFMFAAALAMIASAIAVVNPDASFTDSEEHVPGKFIVVFREDSEPDSRMEHMNILRSRSRSTADSVTHVYNFESTTSFHGYAGNFYPRTLNFIRSQPHIAYIEPMGIARITVENNEKSLIVKNFTTQSNVPSWGLTRSWQRQFTVPNSYNYPASAGKNVDVYVIDTGIYLQHTDFEGRATWGKTFGKYADADGNGHGTHCSGTIGGKLHGIAKKANLIAIKVLSDQGSGTYDDVIAGILFAGSEATRKNSTRSVASMSLGGPKSRAVEDALRAVVQAGVTFAVAAGNSNGADACASSPAGSPFGITVGSTNRFDRLSSYSNAGKCVHVQAPGESIVSAAISGPNASRPLSGTSMAAPHVAGMAALILAELPGTSPADVRDLIVRVSTVGLIKNIPVGTVNKLLFNQF